MQTSQVLLIFALILTAACSPDPGGSRSSSLQNVADLAAENPSAPAELQTLPRDAKFDQLMAGLDFNVRGGTWEYKTNGTSLGLSLHLGGKKIGKWLPTNGAANPEAQVVAYRLGRYLQMSENVAPSAYYTVKGAALRYFAQTMQNHEESNRWREENRENLLNALDRDSTQMFGMFSDSPSTYEVEEVENTDANTINSRHPIAIFMRADGAMPSGSKRISFKNVRKPGGPVASETELELARQLSKILILDALLGQWDRWSGGNLEAAIGDDGTRVYFIARDNGGAGLESGTVDKSLALVTRFDRQQIELLRKLVSELGDPALKSHIVSLLQIRSTGPKLLARAQAVLAHVDKQAQRYGNNAFFP